MSDDLINRRSLEDDMYHEAFETDTDMQRWDSGCWIRYKLFENVIEKQPAVQPKPSWISTSEKLPELSERVLVTDGVQISMSRLGSGYNGSYIWMFDTFWNDLEDLPYWMPLPALPLKESD